MKDSNLLNLERNRYFYGKLLTVRDFEQEQEYHISRRRLINRALFGAGVVCGMSVSASDDTTLLIESGLAIDYMGREVLIPAAVIRKLQMLEGYDAIKSEPSAFLCLEYAEEPTEPVNAVGAEAGDSTQFNKLMEGARLRLTADAPDYRSILESEGRTNVNVLFADGELTIVLYAPEAVCAGEEFPVGVLLVKNADTPPVRFTLSGQTDYIEAENGELTLELVESPEDRQSVVRTELKLSAQDVSDVLSGVFPKGATLRIERGDAVYNGAVTPAMAVAICRDTAAREAFVTKRDSLERRCAPKETPIYLAKLELVNSSGGAFVSGAANLPFAQRVYRGGGESGGANALELSVSSETRALEYWQPPEVRARYNALSEKLHFDFGIPSPQVYDYVTSHGTVDIPITGGMRVNARFFSEEIAHGLGAGNVNISLSVEFEDENGETSGLFGNSEVFKTKSLKKVIPWVETAALLYPERGTMRIGVWLHDSVEGSSIRVHYFAERPDKDSDRILPKTVVSIAVSPEVARIAPRERAHFKGAVSGSEDRSVLWAVKDENGGAIDENGMYQAPETKGTYEITATAGADPSVSASAFIIVE